MIIFFKFGIRVNRRRLVSAFVARHAIRGEPNIIEEKIRLRKGEITWCEKLKAVGEEERALLNSANRIANVGGDRTVHYFCGRSGNFESDSFAYICIFTYRDPCLLQRLMGEPPANEC